MRNGFLGLCGASIPGPCLPLLGELTSKEQDDPGEVHDREKLEKRSGPINVRYAQHGTHRTLTTIQTYQKTFAPFEMGPLPVCTGHSERNPVRTCQVETWKRTVPIMA